jgi:small conductance mechanosensitive channel
MDKLEGFSAQFQAWIFGFGPKLVSALLVFVIGLTIINWASRMISKTMSKNQVDASLKSFLSSMVSVGLKVLLLITVAGMLGIETTSFVAIIGALGLAVGLALQGSLANFAGGVLILVFKPFKTGDLIESGGQKGLVLEIQIFNTILLTPDNKTIILANGAVSNGTIINYTKQGSLRVDINVTLAGDTNIDKAKQVAMDVMKANPLVLADPAPSVAVVGIAGGVTICMMPFTAQANFSAVFTSLQEEFKKAIDANNISGAIPTSIVISKS